MRRTRLPARRRSNPFIDYTDDEDDKKDSKEEDGEEEDEEDEDDKDDGDDRDDDDTDSVGEEPILTMDQLMQCLQTDSYEFLNLLRSDMVRPWWQELYLNWIYPQQVAAEASNTFRSCRPSRMEVRSRIAHKEGGGRTTYSFPYPNRSKWKATDHYARFYFQVKHWNTHDFDGMFYDQDLSESDMETRIFSLLDILINEHSPDRINLPSGGKAIYPNIAKDLPRKALALEDGSH